MGYFASGPERRKRLAIAAAGVVTAIGGGLGGAHLLSENSRISGDLNQSYLTMTAAAFEPTNTATNEPTLIIGSPTAAPTEVASTATAAPTENPTVTQQPSLTPSPTESPSPSPSPSATATETLVPTATPTPDQLAAHADFPEDNSDEDWSFQTVDINNLVVSPLTAHERNLRALDALQKYLAQGAEEKARELLAEDDLLQRYLRETTHYGDDVDPTRPETSGLGFNADTLSHFPQRQLTFDGLWTEESLLDSADLDEPNPRETFLIPRENMVSNALNPDEEGNYLGLHLGTLQELPNGEYTLNYNPHFYGVHNMQWALRAQAIDAFSRMTFGALSVETVQAAAQQYAESIYQRAGFSVDPNLPDANQGGFATIEYTENSQVRRETVTVPNYQGTRELFDNDTVSNDPLDQEVTNRCVLVSMQTSDGSPFEINWNAYEMGANGVWSVPSSINFNRFNENLQQLGVTVETASSTQLAQALYDATAFLSVNSTDLYLDPPQREAVENPDRTVGRQTFFTDRRCQPFVNRPVVQFAPGASVTTTPGLEVTVTLPSQTGTPEQEITPTLPITTPDVTPTYLPTNDPTDSPTRPASDPNAQPTLVYTPQNTPVRATEASQQQPATPRPEQNPTAVSFGNEDQSAQPEEQSSETQSEEEQGE